MNSLLYLRNLNLPISIPLLVLLALCIPTQANPLGDSVRTDIQGYFTATDGSYIAYTVYEGHRGQDLNGDGDTWDQLLSYYDASTGTETITTLAAYSSQDILIDGTTILARVSEYANGQDFNQNGYLYDTLVMQYDITTGQYSYVPADTIYGPFGNTLGDLDGDLYAYIDFQFEVNVYNLSTGVNTNYGRTTNLQTLIDGDHLVFSISEYFSGQDLNGDGDTWDYFYQITNMVTGDTRVLTDFYASYADISGNRMVLQVPEAGQDLNGNGYAYDAVPVLYEIDTEQWTLIPNMDGYQLSIEGNLIAGRSSEYYFGDLNGDGDTYDTFIAFYDIATSTYHLTQNYVYGYNSLGSHLFTFLSSEYRDNVDYNGDGDKWDAFVSYYEIGNLVGGDNAITLADLPDVLRNIDLPKGNQNALMATVEGALADLEKGKTRSAKNKLEATANKVKAQRGKKLSEYEADELLLMLETIIEDINAN